MPDLFFPKEKVTLHHFSIQVPRMNRALWFFESLGWFHDKSRSDSGVWGMAEFVLSDAMLVQLIEPADGSLLSDNLSGGRHLALEFENPQLAAKTFKEKVCSMYSAEVAMGEIDVFIRELSDGRVFVQMKGILEVVLELMSCSQ